MYTLIHTYTHKYTIFKVSQQARSEEKHHVSKRRFFPFSKKKFNCSVKENWGEGRSSYVMGITDALRTVLSRHRCLLYYHVHVLCSIVRFFFHFEIFVCLCIYSVCGWCIYVQSYGRAKIFSLLCQLS